MRGHGAPFWLSIAATLALAACGPAKPPPKRPQVAVAAKPPAPVADAPPTAAQVETAAAPAPQKPRAVGPAKAHKPSRKARPRYARNNRIAPFVPGPQAYGEAYASCMQAANGVTAATADCYSAELGRQSARMDRAYDALAERHEAQRARLSAAQQAWSRRRDAECRRTPAAMVMFREASCRLDITVRRAVEIEQLLG
jgi:uncharacterized protein YecT (DUF1311 family)